MKSEKDFFRLVKAAFNQRRKTLRNAVKDLFEATVLKDELFNKEQEQLPVGQFAALTYQMKWVRLSLLPKRMNTWWTGCRKPGWSPCIIPLLPIANWRIWSVMRKDWLWITRINVDRPLLDKAAKLKWIGRLGSWEWNWWMWSMQNKRYSLYQQSRRKPNAVAEHSLGLYLIFFIKFHGHSRKYDRVWRKRWKQGNWIGW